MISSNWPAHSCFVTISIAIALSSPSLGSFCRCRNAVMGARVAAQVQVENIISFAHVTSRLAICKPTRRLGTLALHAPRDDPISLCLTFPWPLSRSSDNPSGLRRHGWSSLEAVVCLCTSFPSRGVSLRDWLRLSLGCPFQIHRPAPTSMDEAKTMRDACKTPTPYSVKGNRVLDYVCSQALSNLHVAEPFGMLRTHKLWMISNAILTGFPALAG